MPSKAKLVTRASSSSTVSTDTIPKSASLTHAELDSNLINLRDATFGVASDDSTVIDVGMGNTLKVAGSGGVTTAVSGQTLTITGSSGSITIVGDDSTGTAVTVGETFKIAGSNNITTAVSGDTLTITGSKTIDVNEINSGDSSAIQINDNVNVSGTFNAKTIVTNDLISEDSSAINVLDGLNVSGTLSADVLDVNELSSNDSTAIQINDAVNISGAATINNTLAVTSTSTFTGNATFLGSITGDTNSPVTIHPDGTGDVHLNTDSLRIGDLNSDATIATRGTGDLIITTNEGSGTEGVIRIYDGANGNITVTPNGTGDVQLVADTVQIGDSNTDATLTTNGTGDIIINTNSGTNSGSITIQDAANGNISLVVNGSGNVELGSQIETTTNFPSAMTSTSYDPTSTRVRGPIRAYSNLSYAPYTSQDDAHIGLVDYTALKTNGGTFSSTATRHVGSDHTLNFDLNGATVDTGLQTLGTYAVRANRSQLYYKNTAGGTKTGFIGVGGSAFLQADAGHGGAFTVPQIHGHNSAAAISANTGETTTVTQYRGFADLGVTTSGTGTPGTAQILTDYYGFYTGAAPSTFGSGTVISNRPFAFFTTNSTWRSRVGLLDQFRFIGLSATHSSGANYNIDLAVSGNAFHTVTLTSNITGFTFTNAPTSTNAICMVRLMFQQDGTGGRTISFTAGGSEIFLFKNGIKTLTDSTAAPEGLIVDVFSRYDGTNTRYYWNIDNGEYIL